MNTHLQRLAKTIQFRYNDALVSQNASLKTRYIYGTNTGAKQMLPSTGPDDQ